MSYEQDPEHRKMYAENYWYRAWYDTMKSEIALMNKLDDLAGKVRIFLSGAEDLPKDTDWDGMVAVTKSGWGYVTTAAKEAEVLVKDAKSRRNK